MKQKIILVYQMYYEQSFGSNYDNLAQVCQ